jgi:hypothetical protein
MSAHREILLSVDTLGEGTVPTFFGRPTLCR